MKTRLTGWLTTIFLVCIQCCIVFGQSNQPTGQPQTPSFRRDVMPVFFRAGCNSGTCHGSARGKDGFMLSLFGYDPAGDYRRTVEEMPGRRINVSVPQESLLLLKATASVPHTGGKLFDRDSRLYQTLLEWIEA
ncbi:MAG: cell surface protein, partial [Planctomycetota bacterium]